MVAPSSQRFLSFTVLAALLAALSAIGSGLFVTYLAHPYIVGSSPAAESGAILLLGTVGVGIVAGLIGWVSGAKTSRRIRELIHRTELITTRSTSLPSAHVATDELGALQVAFGRLMISIDRFVRDSDILSHLPQGLLYLGPSGILIEFNPGAEKVLGISLDAYSKKVVWGRDGLFADGPDNDRLKDLCYRVISTDEMVQGGEMNLQLGNGESRLLEVNLQRWQEGEQTVALIVFQDATEKQRIREQIRHANQLAFLGGLTAQLAHQVGTPLTVIRGLGELLQKDLAATDSRQEYMRRILVGVDRIEQLVKSLLTLANPDLSTREPVSLNRLMDDVLDLVSEEDRKRLKIEFAPSLPPVIGDPILLTEVFANLIKNALEATTQGRNASVKAVAQGQAIQITVTNTGMGIPKAMRGQIFEPFFTTKAHGTGLGLAIARQLVESHGGHITVDSDGSTWTSFEVDLPITGHQQPATTVNA